ncbi:MAG: hypothetical protein WA701_14500 [Solirubrobacterales bacterium]
MADDKPSKPRDPHHSINEPATDPDPSTSEPNHEVDPEVDPRKANPHEKRRAERRRAG